MLTLENIKWSTPEGTKILDGVNLEIPDGKLVVITGPNGGGKTTLAKVIAGIVTPDEGTILLNGEDITKLDVTERAKKGIGFAFQQPVRFKGVTVHQLLNWSAGKELSDAELCDILGNVGLCAGEYVGREVSSALSGGEIKRIEIATVIARGTKLSVFDEPEAGIDLWSFASLIKAFRRIHEELGGTLIIISHQERILRIADEIVLLSGGKLEAKGTSDEMMEKVLSSGSTAYSCRQQEVAFNE